MRKIPDLRYIENCHNTQNKNQYFLKAITNFNSRNYRKHNYIRSSKIHRSSAFKDCSNADGSGNSSGLMEPIKLGHFLLSSMHLFVHDVAITSQDHAHQTDDFLQINPVINQEIFRC